MKTKYLCAFPRPPPPSAAALVPEMENEKKGREKARAGSRQELLFLSAVGLAG